MKQREMAMVGEVKEMEMLPLEAISRCKNRRHAINLCMNWSGVQDGTLAKELGIDPGQLSRIRSGGSHFPDHKDDLLMQVCRNYAPLQYSAWRHGFDLVARSKEERLRELEAERERLLNEIDRRDAA